MQLPADLRNVLDGLFEQTSMTVLEQAAGRLSSRYRQELRDGTMHLDNKNAALGYVAARFPATFAAVHDALCRVKEVLPDFCPTSQLDVGAGPATAVLAAHEVFSSLQSATLVEQSDAITEIGKALAASLKAIDIHWQKGDLAACGFDNITNGDLVTLSYVLDELADETQDRLVDSLWQKTGKVLLLVEPGTPAGWRRLLRQRARLIAQNAEIVAPCPHQAPCPLVLPDWCHFSVRVERSRTHRLTKQASVPYEDEKYSYLALAKRIKIPQYYRIIGRPRRSSGKISFSICCPNGEKNSENITRKSKECYRLLRKAEWGQILKKTKP